MRQLYFAAFKQYHDERIYYPIGQLYHQHNKSEAGEVQVTCLPVPYYISDAKCKNKTYEAQDNNRDVFFPG